MERLYCIMIAFDVQAKQGKTWAEGDCSKFPENDKGEHTKSM